MRIHRFLAWPLVFLALAGQAAAQLANSSLSGTATGADGSGLPGVTVTLRNQESGLVRTTVTAGNCTYAISGAKPGLYVVTFDLEGFPAVSRESVELRVGQETRLSATLTLEQMAQLPLAPYPEIQRWGAGLNALPAWSATLAMQAPPAVAA